MTNHTRAIAIIEWNLKLIIRQRTVNDRVDFFFFTKTVLIISQPSRVYTVQMRRRGWLTRAMAECSLLLQQNVIALHDCIHAELQCRCRLHCSCIFSLYRVLLRSPYSVIAIYQLFSSKKHLIRFWFYFSRRFVVIYFPLYSCRQFHATAV